MEIGRFATSQAAELEIDETSIDYQDPGHGTVREGRLWACRAPVVGTCYFDWHAGRGTNCLLEMLGYPQVRGGGGQRCLQPAELLNIYPTFIDRTAILEPAMLRLRALTRLGDG